MAWEGSDRASRLPSDWGSLVKAVRARDGGRCTWRLPSGARCPRSGAEVDHRKPGDDHSMSNLQLLCWDHHRRKTLAEARDAKRRRRQGSQKRQEPHPGMVRRVE